MSFISELKRRNVFKVAVVYAIMGWLLIQVAATVFPLLQLPEWTATLVAVLLIMGFPVALVLSWAYDVTPEGMKRSTDAPAPESTTQGFGRKIDFVIIGALALALAFVVFSYVLDDGTEDAIGILPNSIAVLPFRNDSPDPDNAYYASGIHEEVLNRLAKLSGLNVISRTSVEQYADTEKPIPEIAEELNVETVMEGSVRYAADRIRVTTQLINPQTGAHLWSETYDREFADIFAVESDIAMNVANALEVEFSLDEQDRIERVPTESTAAYALYLEAIGASTSQENRGERAYPLIERAIALDENFALAYAWRATFDSNSLAGVGLGISPDEALEVERRVREDAERALSIDPTLGLAYTAMAGVHHANWRGRAAEEAFQNSLRLNPNDADVLGFYGRFKRDRGEREESIRLLQRAVELDPNNGFAHFQLGLTYRFFADWDAAAAVLERLVLRFPANATAHVNLGLVEASRGNAAEALRLLQFAERLGEMALFRLAQMVNAYALAGYPEDAARVFEEFEERATEEGIGDAWWAYAYFALGDYSQAMQRLESAVHGRLPINQTPLTILWMNPWNYPELQTAEVRNLLDGLWDDA